MPGFQPTQGTWNWNADARQVAVLTELAAKGQDVILEAFSNSPPYWMTKSGCASGNTDGSNNLKDNAYDLFAGYLTDVVKHFHDDLTSTTISVLRSEPWNR
jgi:O-glycosyl hydrolase